MLKVKHISKTYKTGDLVQKALNDVSLTLRECEFVAILGPSGSGKTTLLNIIGGLDRYDEGDLVINSVSTKKYRDRDWDSYRNHSIGFVFQSYNLIEHQSVLANVELALTISGMKRKERREKAKEALVRVGLAEHLHKRPSQLSGGQMQRVAIARALVNDPKILLADEPTGALDTETSVQVMELLKEVARDRLVVMVTHNPELAESYATRIVSLKDGKITTDSNPYEVEENEASHRNFGRASMSFFTALSLSFKNLLTKKARTILTSFAGSIGIIGIALILSLSQGVNNYIDAIQKDAMTSYPITIQAETLNLSALFKAGADTMSDTEADHALDRVYSNTDTFEMASLASTSLTKNNLTDFKKYLDDPESDIREFLGETGVVYTYATKFSLYTYDSDGFLVNTDGSTLSEKQNLTSDIIGSMSQMMSGMGSSMGMSSFRSDSMTTYAYATPSEQILPARDGGGISPAIRDNYALVEGGRWPEAHHEMVLVVNENMELPASVLYQLGFLPTAEYRSLISKLERGEELTLDADSFSFDEIYEKEFLLLSASDLFVKNENDLFEAAAQDPATLSALLADAVKVKITGIIYPTGNQSLISAPLAYTTALTDYLIAHTAESDVVMAQEASPDKSVLSGMKFAPDTDEAKVQDTIDYLSSLSISEKAKFFDKLTTLAAMQGMAGGATEDETETGKGEMQLPEGGMQLPEGGMQLPEGGMTAMDPEAQKAAMLDAYLAVPKPEELLKIYDLYISPGTYDDNLKAFGVVSYDAPESVSIYVDTFENKDRVAECISRYNEGVSEENRITYTDFVGLLMSSMTTIIDVISYVLIAFVSVSLIVSSIMIGIITYISVLERTKEIGILRAIGASKRNISQVFNAETFVIGLCAGTLGVLITLLLLIPINAIIHFLAGTTSINAVLPLPAAITLILLSLVLTVISGLLPAKKAAKKDPVSALRSE